MSNPKPEPIFVPVRVPERGQTLVTMMVIMVSIVVLYLGAGILVPLVLAVLLAFALAPLIRLLRRMNLPHIVAVLVAVLMAGAVLATIGYVVASQLIKLASDLPSYQATVMTKTQALQHSLGSGGFIESLSGALATISDQVAGGFDTGAVAPTRVTITNGGAGPLDIVQVVLGSVLGPLATAAIVVVFLIFLLLEREGLRDRFLKLVSRGDLRTSTKVMNEAAARVGRYLLVQFGVNLSYGTVFAIGLSFIGVPNAILWGLLAAMFRYIPFVGTIIAATIPFTLAFAVDPGWSMLLWSVGLYVALELIITNAIEPRLYGSSTGLSAIAVLVAAMFWATLWGPIGLILSTPMTVCLVVLGRYVPQLAFFETLLGSEPVMAPPERFYQRLVSANVVEAIELADEFIADHGVTAFYEKVAMPALRSAETDLSLDVADLSHRRNVVDSLNTVLEDIDVEQNQHITATVPTVLCIGGRTELDEAAAQILVRLLYGSGVSAKAFAPLAVRQETIAQLPLDGVQVVCLCYLGTSPKSYVRFVSRRLLRHYPELKIVACVFGGDAAATITPSDWGVTRMVGSLHAAAAAAVELSAQTAPAEAETALSSPIDEEGIGRLRHLSRSDGPLSEELGEIAASMGVPVAILHIAESGLRMALEGDEVQRRDAASERVVDEQAPVVIPNVAESAAFANDPFMLENGIRFYVGVPLLGPNGKVIGALALLDYEPRIFSEADQETLELHALRLMVEVDRMQEALEPPAPTDVGIA